MLQRIRLAALSASLCLASVALAQGVPPPPPLPEPVPITALAPAPAPAPATVIKQVPVASTPAPSSAGQQASGTVLEVSVQEVMSVVGGSGSNLVVLGTPASKLFLGGKTGRAVIGVGLELLRLGASSSSGTFSSSSSQTQATISAGLRVALAQSADEKVEVLGVVNLGIGHAFTDSSPSSSNSSGGNYRILFEAGPALRYWVHPQFAVGATAGLRSDQYFADSGSGSSSSSVGVTSIFTGLNLLGVF